MVVDVRSSGPVAMIAGFLKKNWFLLALLAAIALAWLAPHVGAPGGTLRTEITVHVAVAVSFLISGLTLPTEALVRAVGQLRLHLFVQGFNFLVIPLIALALVPLFAACGAPVLLGSALVALACMPTTIASAAVLTRSAGGNEAAAVFNTTIGNLLGILVSPLLLMLLLSARGTVPVETVFIQLGQEVAAPLAIGQVLHHLLKCRWTPPSWFGQIASLCVAYILYGVFCHAFAAGEFSHGGTYPLWVLAAVLTLHGLALGLSWRLSGWRSWGFAHADRIAVLYCSTQKTLALGAPMLAIIWRGSPDLAALTLPIIVHHLVQIAVGGFLASGLRRTSAR